MNKLTIFASLLSLVTGFFLASCAHDEPTTTTTTTTHETQVTRPTATTQTTTTRY